MGVMTAGSAHANGETSATVKGAAGGALLGAESVMLIQAAAGVKPAWAYGVGGGLGAVAGGIGGFIIEQDLNPKVSLYMLVGGMALAIPTTVAVLSATAYEPVNYVEDRPAPEEPIAEPPQGGPTPPAPPAPATQPTSHAPVHRTAPIAKLPPVPPALLGLSQGTLTLSVPAVEVGHVFTRTEIATLGVKQATQVSVPVFSAVF